MHFHNIIKEYISGFCLACTYAIVSSIVYIPKFSGMSLIYDKVTFIGSFFLEKSPVVSNKHQLPKINPANKYHFIYPFDCFACKFI